MASVYDKSMMKLTQVRIREETLDCTGPARRSKRFEYRFVGGLVLMNAAIHAAASVCELVCFIALRPVKKKEYEHELFTATPLIYSVNIP